MVATAESIGGQPGGAGDDVSGGRVLVDPSRPVVGGLPPEVLDRVGHVGGLPVDAGQVQRLVQDPAGRSDERPTGPVLGVTGLLWSPRQESP